jgi:hypothetical protein
MDDEVSARVEVVDAVDDPLAVSVPKSEVERALEANEEVDLVLDVIRTNGEREERRVSLSWDREALESLAQQEGERVIIAVDPTSLGAAFDDVEAHGMREVGATLAVLVATAAGGAGMAQAYPADGATPAGGASTPTVEATVNTTAFPVTVEGQSTPDAGMPRAMPSDYAAAGIGTPGLTEGERAALVQQHRARIGAEEAGPGGAVRDLAPDTWDAVVATETPDPSAGIENVRATRTAPEAGDSGGITIDAPSAGVTAALAGGAALTIAAAAFALRRRREPEPAT